MKKILIMIIMILGLESLFAKNTYSSINDIPPNRIYASEELEDIMVASDKMEMVEYSNFGYEANCYFLKNELKKYKYPKADKSLTRMIINYEDYDFDKSYAVVIDTKLEWIFQNSSNIAVIGVDKTGRIFLNFINDILCEKIWAYWVIPENHKIVCAISSYNNFVYFEGNSKTVIRYNYFSNTYAPVSATKLELKNPCIYKIIDTKKDENYLVIRDIDQRGIPTSNDYWKITDNNVEKLTDDAFDTKKRVVETKPLQWSNLIPGQEYQTEDFIELVKSNGSDLQVENDVKNNFFYTKIYNINEPKYDQPKSKKEYNRNLFLARGPDDVTNLICVDLTADSLFAHNKSYFIINGLNEKNEQLFCSLEQKNPQRHWKVFVYGKNQIKGSYLVNESLFFWDMKLKKLRIFNILTQEVNDIKGAESIKNYPVGYSTEEGPFIREVDSERYPLSKIYYKINFADGKCFLEKMEDK